MTAAPSSSTAEPPLFDLVEQRAFGSLLRRARADPSALLAPSPIETLEFGEARGLVTRADVDRLTAELLANPTARSRELAEATRPVTEDARYRERLAAAVARGNAKLARVERIKSFIILPRDFSQEAGELTPTMKMKRGVIEANYREILDRAYAEEGYAIPVAGNKHGR